MCVCVCVCVRAHTHTRTQVLRPNRHIFLYVAMCSSVLQCVFILTYIPICTLQCVYMYVACRVLQCVAVRCSVYIYLHTSRRNAYISTPHCNILQHNTTYTLHHTALYTWTCICNNYMHIEDMHLLPQHTATHCNTMQHTHCITLHHTHERVHVQIICILKRGTYLYNTLQNTCECTYVTWLLVSYTYRRDAYISANHCNTLQHTATHCNINIYMKIYM